METALAKALDEVAIHLTPEIVKGEGNIVFHCEWDNLNNTTSSVHGSNIVSSAKDIMVQEVNPEFENSDVRTLPVIDKSPQRSLKVDTPRESTIEYFTTGGEDPVTEIKPPATYRAKCQRQYSCTLVVYTASTASWKLGTNTGKCQRLQVCYPSTNHRQLTCARTSQALRGCNR